MNYLTELETDEISLKDAYKSDSDKLTEVRDVLIRKYGTYEYKVMLRRVMAIIEKEG